MNDLEQKRARFAELAAEWQKTRREKSSSHRDGSPHEWVSPLPADIIRAGVDACMNARQMSAELGVKTSKIYDTAHYAGIPLRPSQTASLAVELETVMIALAKETGKVPTNDELRRNHGFSQPFIENNRLSQEYLEGIVGHPLKPKTKAPLTDDEVLSFMMEYASENGRLPRLCDAAEHFDKSRATIARHWPSRAERKEMITIRRLVSEAA